jgi:MYXO-CTERM domain-containing protein
VAAGIAGLLVSAAPDKTSQELYDVLIKTARPAPFAVPDDKGHDQVYGYGIIDPVAALDALNPQETPDGGADGGTTPPEESGCSCKQAPSAPAGGALYAIGLALAAFRARRRR